MVLFVLLSGNKKRTRGGIRTRDLLLRRETRYPLRYTDEQKTCSILGRVVKALDLSPSGLSPRGFEPRRMHSFFEGEFPRLSTFFLSGTKH